MVNLKIHLRAFAVLSIAALVGACVPDEAQPPNPQPNDNPVILKAEFVGPWIEVSLGSTSEAFTLLADGSVKSNNNFGLITHWRASDENLYLTLSGLVGGDSPTEEVAFPVKCVDDYGCRIEMGGAPIWRYFK